MKIVNCQHYIFLQHFPSLLKNSIMEKPLGPGALSVSTWANDFENFHLQERSLQPLFLIFIDLRTVWIFKKWPPVLWLRVEFFIELHHWLFWFQQLVWPLLLLQPAYEWNCTSCGLLPFFEKTLCSYLLVEATILWISVSNLPFIFGEFLQFYQHNCPN